MTVEETQYELAKWQELATWGRNCACCYRRVLPEELFGDPPVLCKVCHDVAVEIVNGDWNYK